MREAAPRGEAGAVPVEQLRVQVVGEGVARQGGAVRRAGSFVVPEPVTQPAQALPVLRRPVVELQTRLERCGSVRVPPLAHQHAHQAGA